MAEGLYGPTRPGTVVLDLRPGVGALILHTPQELNGQEIEISPAGTLGVRRSHAQVREPHAHERARPLAGAAEEAALGAAVRAQALHVLPVPRALLEAALVDASSSGARKFASSAPRRLTLSPTAMFACCRALLPSVARSFRAA